MSIKYFSFGDFNATIKWMFVDETSRFEKEFAEFIGTEHAIATSYGRTALYLGLKAIGVQGNEIILPSFTCTVVRHAVILAGAIPRFVDVDTGNFNLSKTDLKRKITPLTKAIIITHYFGGVASNLKEIIEIGRDNNLILIEDCAHSLGAEYDGVKIGSFGDFAIFSLTKGMINFGGGMMVTNDDALFAKARGILKKESFGILRKVSDFPLLLSYGVEQIIDKLFYDRPKRSIFKWWAIKILPASIVGFRKFIMFILKNFLMQYNQALTKTDRQKNKTPDNNNVITEPNPYQLKISRISASVGRVQLKKVPNIIHKRKTIYSEIARRIDCIHDIFENGSNKMTYANIVLKNSSYNTKNFVEMCKKHGILLRETWPTHQLLFPEQKTKTITAIESEIVIYNLNPMISRSEIIKFVDTINSLQKSV